ncbi:MAG: glutamine synthetase, partial [Gaiellales bacterium]|nr:glutamine synthetase [Gaiellales bacterium]
DMYFLPDPETYAVLPWRGTETARTARLICDVADPDGQAFAGDPRSNLKRVLKQAEQLGYTMQVGPEAEFFLFRLDDEGNPTVDPHDSASYFDVAPMDKGEDCRRDIELTLQQMGFHLEAAHHEVAIGQHEIDFRHGDALSTADNLITFRMVVKVIAAQHGMHATFMAKPLHGENGSGMHVNQSLSRGDENAFLDESDDLKLSKEAYSYIAGILGHLPAITAVANPTVNSYKRLLPGYEAPVYIAWSPGNRSAAIRVPAKRGRSTRIELRTPDPTANPYLALACMLQAGLDGIVNGHTPPAPVNRNIYDLTEEESVQFGITSLPHDLSKALDALEADAVMREALGEHIFSEYIRLKRDEWAAYNEQVHKWEIDQYMDRY